MISSTIILRAFAAAVFLAAMTLCQGEQSDEGSIVGRQKRSAPWMNQMLRNPEVRHVLAEYMLYTPAESKRAIIDSLGGDYLIKKRRVLDPYRK